MTARKIVFITGAPRSGTSIIWMAIRRALEAVPYGESHMMPLFARQARSMQEDFAILPGREHKGTLAARTEPPVLHGQFLEVVRRFYDDAFQKSHIVDKTPTLEAVEAIPFVREVYPSARFIFCHRRPLENIESRLRKWPEASFESHCVWWSKIMGAWRSIKGELSENDYLEVDQRYVTIAPGGVASSLGLWLDLSPMQIEQIVDTFNTQEASMIRGSNKDRLLSLSTVSWNEERKSIFLRICGDEMIRWGYTLDETYSQKGNARSRTKREQSPGQRRARSGNPT